MSRCTFGPDGPPLEWKARFYDEVGVEGVYDPKNNSVEVEARVLNGRVGGGT
jgi:hypothetical protein